MKEGKSILVIGVCLSLGILIVSSTFSISLAQKKEQVRLKAILSEDRWDNFIGNATQRLMEKHPDMDIHVQSQILPSEKIRFLTALSNQTPIDLVSLDQIWIGEFADKGLISDITKYVQDRKEDWYQSNWGGGLYNHSVYGIWTWTDIRGIWYWKDLLNHSGVAPDSLKTWDGYIATAKQLNAVLRPEGIEGIHLVGANHSQDMWYPYLWMLGGELLELKSGHPSKGTYWYPAYNSSKGVKALEFLKEQVDAGIKPQKNHEWGQEFVGRKFAVMLEGSWMPGEFPLDQWGDLKKKIGFIPMFPVPFIENRTTTTMGGWELGIPSNSIHKDLAGELLKLMISPEILTGMLEENGYLPTQIPIGQGPYANRMRDSIPYYAEMVSMIPFGHTRPNIAEYPEIADNIREAINEVYYGIKEPQKALNDAAAKTAKVLGWLK